LQDSLHCNHFGHLLAGVGTNVASVGAIVHARLITCFLTMRTHLGAYLSDIASKRGAVLHKVCRCQAQFGTVEQKIPINSLSLLHRIRRILADLMTVEAILDTILYLLL
jgi:hypothetical protein